MLTNIKKNLLVIFSILILIFSRFYRLGLDIVHNDAFYFKNTTYILMQNAKAGVFDFLLTIQPGVITVYSCMLGYKTLFLAKDYGFVNAQGKEFELLLHTFQKFPMVLLGVFLVFILVFIFSKMSEYLYLKEQKNISKYSALVILVLALEPDFVLHSRVIQTDVLQALFILISLTLYYLHLQHKKASLVFISGAFGGLAFIQKSPSLIILPFIVSYGLYFSSTSSFKNTLTRHTLKSIFMYFFTFSLVAFVLFPAYWFAPIDTLRLMTYDVFLKGLKGIEVDIGNVYTPHAQSPYYYPIYFLVKYSSIYLFGLAIGVYQTFMKDSKTKNYYLMLLLFTLLYAFMLQISEKKMFRYVPVLTITLTPLVAYGYFTVLQKFKFIYLFIVVFYTFNYVRYFPDFGLYKNIWTHIVAYDLPLDPYKGYVEGGTGMYRLSQYLNSNYPGISVSLPRSDGIKLFLNSSANELDFTKVANSNDLVILNSNDPNIKTLENYGYLSIDSFKVNADLVFTIYGLQSR